MGSCGGGGCSGGGHLPAGPHTQLNSALIKKHYKIRLAMIKWIIFTLIPLLSHGTPAQSLLFPLPWTHTQGPSPCQKPGIVLWQSWETAEKRHFHHALLIFHLPWNKCPLLISLKTDHFCFAHYTDLSKALCPSMKNKGKLQWCHFPAELMDCTSCGCFQLLCLLNHAANFTSHLLQ